MAKKQASGPSGLIVVDKPAGITSHDVVSKMRWIASTRKVGHAGTLDPMATGVLVLGVNKATRLLTWVVGEQKTYTTVIRLGISTLTDDADGRVTRVAEPGALEDLTEQQVRSEIDKLTGEIMQVPSAVSAIKVGGVRSYARVRSGQEVELEARPVTVHTFTLQGLREQTVQVQLAPETGEAAAGDETVTRSCRVVDLEASITCSAGTYIRALARDLGQALGVGAHLTRLRRTAVGDISVGDAHSLQSLVQLREEGGQPPLLPLEEAARRLFRTRNLSGAEASDLSHGRPIAPGPGEVTPGVRAGGAGTTGGKEKPGTAGISAGFAPDGTLVALLENTRRKGSLLATPILVFEPGKTFEENPRDDRWS